MNKPIDISEQIAIIRIAPEKENKMRVALNRKQFEEFRQTLESMYLQSIALPKFSQEQKTTSNGAIHTLTFSNTPQNVKQARLAFHYAGIKLK